MNSHAVLHKEETMVPFWSLQCDSFAYHRGNFSLNVFSRRPFLLLRNEMKIQYISMPQRYSLLSILKDGARCERSVSVFGRFTSKSELLFLSGKQVRDFQRPWRDKNILLAGNKPQIFQNISSCPVVLTWLILVEMWVRIAQQVQRLATHQTVRGSNPVTGETFGTRPDRP